MKLTEAEMRMVFQIESTNQNAALNEIYMTWRYAPNPATKETAESLLDKLRPLSDQECMDLIRKVQAEYHLPEKARTIGEMLAEARQRSGAQKLSGHDIMALERFDPATRHMIVFDVLTHDSPVGWKGEKMRLFLTDAGYSKALENQEKGHIKIRNHAKMGIKGNIKVKDFEVLTRANQFKKVVEILKDNSDIAIPLEVNACFACELYLKYLVNFKKKNVQEVDAKDLVHGKGNGHGLKALYDDVGDEIKHLIVDKMYKGFESSLEKI